MTEVQKRRPRHTGGYFRMALGFGGFFGAEQADGGFRGSISGWAAPGLQFGVGGSAIPGLALGVGADFEKMTDTSGSVSRSGTLFGVGPFFDVYPNPSDGFHVQVAARYTMLSLGVLPSGDYDGTGIGLDVGVGLEGPFSSQWGGGLMLRAQCFAGTLRDTGPGPNGPGPNRSVSFCSPGLFLTGTMY